MTVVNSPRAFAGRVIVVTGAAGGIGAAVSAGLREAGARVVGVDLSGADVDCDVTDAAALREALSRHAPDEVHGLVTLAGGSLGTPRDLDTIDDVHVDRVIDVNVKGTLHACRAVASRLRATKGAIVTCASIGARQPSPVTGVPYATAKAAIGGLTRRLAAELGPDGVRVNSVAPGLFLTDRLRGMFDGMSEAERAEVVDAIALRRMPQLREIVEPIMFLLSDAAGYITGATLDVNGGRYMPP